MAITAEWLKNNLDMQMRTSISGSKEHALLYRNDKYGCQMEIHTPVKKGMRDEHGNPDRFGKATRTFYIDGDEREFTDPQKFIEALVEKVNSSPATQGGA